MLVTVYTTGQEMILRAKISWKEKNNIYMILFSRRWDSKIYYVYLNLTNLLLLLLVTIFTLIKVWVRISRCPKMFNNSERHNIPELKYSSEYS